MRVVIIPTLFDNYTYLIVCEKTGEAAVVDSPDAEATLEVIRREGVNFSAILSTHHHADHVAGNTDLVKFKRVPVYGSVYDRDRVPELTQTVREGDVVSVGALKFSVIEIPGHTLGHVAYRNYENLFCGDTLFAGGCGRLFEGTPEMMVTSLTKLKNLPDDTRVYCGHEYTQKNLEFALTLEPTNQALLKKYDEVCAARKEDRPTVPTTIGEEKSYNPMLRWESPALQESLRAKMPDLKSDPVSVFAAVRGLKDKF